ncbi:sugar phosphate isomerase/epimerase [Phenylobacterium sp. SCN 70-31]|uniref:sugar phosphate isomerase/epimerase family protein n=1 Tax=Phenylobacterium sp. SCN 70-31 TaxID=1660129 RepID=UPI00086B799B|nr:sugar phosphate isomerase/epimerase [Phenylobacterium sp. SCN 70-31]ODT89631.1 MAG: xylose isomerase [Phenylobacterium sp. SCN 70-31]
MRTRLSDPSRRGFLAAGAALAGAAMTGPAAAAQPFFKRVGLPIGIQLYTLGPDAAKDLDGTLAAVAAMGYRNVELAGFLGRKPVEMRAALDRAGLKCASAHVQARALGPDGGFDGDLDKLAEGLAAVGAVNAVMPSPRIPDRLAGRPAEGESIGDFYRRVTGALTLHDWQMNAAFLNEKGAVLKKAGIRIGYHNHNFEFRPLSGNSGGETTGMEVLLKETDPDVVTFEIDVGWVAAAGLDPIALMQKHKGRFTMMHVKDLKAGTEPNFALSMQPTEIGSGKLDWKRLLPAAYAAGVRGFYVEQEPPFERPRIEAAKINHDFLAGVTA